MIDNLKKFLNEEQDPKAIAKITSKLNDLLMKNEEVGYIAVQKKPAITVFPDSIVVTNKRIIICQPKNMGLSMNFTDFTWDEIESTFMKENILGSEFSFSTKTQIQVSIDYIPKIQARKISTYAKEQLDRSSKKAYRFLQDKPKTHWQYQKKSKRIQTISEVFSLFSLRSILVWIIAIVNLGLHQSNIQFFGKPFRER